MARRRSAEKKFETLRPKHRKKRPQTSASKNSSKFRPKVLQMICRRRVIKQQKTRSKIKRRIINSKLSQTQKKKEARKSSREAIVSVCGCNNSNSRSNNAKWNFKIQKNLLKNVSHLICPFYRSLSRSLELRGFYDKLTFSSR